MQNNPILRTLQENDIVMIEVPSIERADIKQICKIFNLKFEEQNDEFKIDWLDFDAEIIYTNIKLHQSMLDSPAGNCMAITEKIDLNNLEQIAKLNDMWKSSLYLLSDAELNHKRNQFTNS